MALFREKANDNSNERFNFQLLLLSPLHQGLPMICVTVNDSLIFEACVESLAEALAAERQGAHRIELCSALDQDGLTPSAELARQCVDRLSIPTMVMIRPRGGDFVHTDAEIEAMALDIELFRQAGVAGVVFGLLSAEKTIDSENTKRLVSLAWPMAVTFHKAIDHSFDVLESFRELNGIDGISRVLTSGGGATAWNGRDVLRAMNDLPGRRIAIIAAGNVLPGNRERLADYTGVGELHGRRIVSPSR
jgi:copper homeostasis protein